MGLEGILIIRVQFQFPIHILCRPKTPRNGGDWAEWGAWGSECNSNCRLTRERICADPIPLFGGENCTGDSVEEGTEPCHGGDCCPGVKEAV